ncbi:MAG TPA: hypothetical protein VGJ91_24790 [Polyangiaceae bacterium]
MRVLAACLLGVLGLGALATTVACSDTTDSSSGGTGGGSSAGAGGKASAAGSGGAECKFESDGCTNCLGEHCMTESGACVDDATCAPAVYALRGCVCDPTMKPADCQATFMTDGGDLAKDVITCFSTNCASACQ